MNSVHLIGNLTRDPDLKHTPSGVGLCKLRIAVNDRKKDPATGQWGDVPYYFDVTVWGQQGENVAQWLSKGKKVAVSGKLTWREWHAQDGTKRQSVEIEAFPFGVDFLTPRDQGSPAPAGQGAMAQEEYRSTAGQEEDFTSQAGVDDDIPF